MTPAPRSKRAIAEEQYGASRVNMVFLLLLTVTNLVMLACGADWMMLSSASIPYFAAGFGQVSGQLLWACLGYAVAIALVALYAVCFRLSKTRHQWMTVAAVLFGIDCLFVVGLYIAFPKMMSVWDLLVHAWVMFDLIKGVVNAHKLKTLPVDDGPDWNEL